MTDSANTSDGDVQIPRVIRQYQDAHDRHDTSRALAAFAADATVIDEDHEHRGTAAIRQWLDTAAREFTYTRTGLGASRIAPDTWLVDNRLEGTFPGGVADLQYRFVLRDGRIAELVIAP
jgi:ketosteroid isomerase-like protein